MPFQPVFYGDWGNYSDFQQHHFDRSKPKEPACAEEDLIFAGYSYECYEGEYLVLFVHKDTTGSKLMLVAGHHCSCDGGTWEPEETSIAALRMMPGPKAVAACEAFDSWLGMSPAGAN